VSSEGIRGLWVPLVTPMRAGAVDLDSLARLVTSLLERGVDGVVACGSTGECVTLSDTEQDEVIGAAVAVAGGQRVVAGSVAVATSAALARSAAAAAAGARALLLLSPTLLGLGQADMATHYRTVAEGALPVLVYNFPARTGGGVAATTVLELAGEPRIVGTKQSVAALDADLTRLLLDAPAGFDVLVGSPTLLWPALALGGSGGILAAAHLEATALAEVVRAARLGDLAAARAAYRQVWPRLPAAEGVPAIKAALHEQGLLASAEVRAPLTVSGAAARG